MTHPRAAAFAFCVALSTAATPPARADTRGIGALGLHVTPCVLGRSAVAARCGTFGVYEDRAARAGRVVALRVVVLAARHPGGKAVAFIAGGPGQSAVAFAPAIADGRLARELSAVRDRYDILFVDSRGMGDSNPFRCDFAPASDPRAYFRQLWPDRLVSACRRQSGTTSVARRYATNDAVDDLDDVRGALGYRRMVLDGGSYGTFFAFVYVRRHPTRVESAVLDGVYAPHFQPVPGAPAAAQRALDDLASKCGRDAVCRTHFPRFLRHFRDVIARFDRGPVAMSLRRPHEVPHAVRLSKEVLVDDLRQMLDQPENAAYLPAVIEAAWRHDYGPLAQVVDAVAQGLSHGLNWGAFLSYTCADEIPFISAAQVRQEAARSFAGALRVRAQRRACELWNVPPMPRAFNDPVRSRVRVLMVSGSDDPATPPRYAAGELPYLTNGVQIVVRGAGHATETACADRVKVQFIERRSPGTVRRTRCEGAYVPPHFATSW